MQLIIIDTEKISSELKWEDEDGIDRYYPHVYGFIDMNAIVDIVPLEIDENGQWIKNHFLFQKFSDE